MRLRPWELRALVATDQSYLARCAELANTKPEDQVSDTPLTPAVFDRMFG